MEDDLDPMQNPLIRKIDQIRRKTGFDESFIEAAAFHYKVLRKYEKIQYFASVYNDAARHVLLHSSDPIYGTRQDVCDLLLSKLFFDKMDMYPTKRFKCQVSEDSYWPVRLLPAECFGKHKISDTYKYKYFYDCLNVSDMLDCRVTNVNPSDYHLKVIHKYGTTGVLDDLNLKVIMLKNKTDMRLLQKELLPCELIRVRVTEIMKEGKNYNIYVTVKEENLEEMEELRKLGRIPDEVLPPYVLNPHDAEMFLSYSKYLYNMPQFRNPILLNDIYAGFGADPIMMYSFYPEYHRSKCDEESNGQSLLKESKNLDARKFVHLAIKECEDGNFSVALIHINKAIEVCPQKDELAFNLYYIRGTVHWEAQKPKFSLQAFSDWTKAYSMNPKDGEVKKKISLCLFQIANKYYRKKEFKNAFKNAEKALEYDQDNVEANALIEYLKKNHPEIFFDEESLVTLQEKQMELVTKLKKC